MYKRQGLGRAGATGAAGAAAGAGLSLAGGVITGVIAIGVTALSWRSTRKKKKAIEDAKRAQYFGALEQYRGQLTGVKRKTTAQLARVNKAIYGGASQQILDKSVSQVGKIQRILGSQAKGVVAETAKDRIQQTLKSASDYALAQETRLNLKTDLFNRALASIHAEQSADRGGWADGIIRTQAIEAAEAAFDELARLG